MTHRYALIRGTRHLGSQRAGRLGDRLGCGYGDRAWERRRARDAWDSHIIDLGGATVVALGELSPCSWVARQTSPHARKETPRPAGGTERGALWTPRSAYAASRRRVGGCCTSGPLDGASQSLSSGRSSSADVKSYALESPRRPAPPIAPRSTQRAEAGRDSHIPHDRRAGGLQPATCRWVADRVTGGAPPMLASAGCSHIPRFERSPASTYAGTTSGTSRRRELLPWSVTGQAVATGSSAW